MFELSNGKPETFSIITEPPEDQPNSGNTSNIRGAATNENVKLLSSKSAPFFVICTDTELPKVV